MEINNTIFITRVRKTMHLIVILLVGMPVWCQESEKEYIHQPMEYVTWCIDSIAGKPYFWRDRPLYQTGLYSDTVFMPELIPDTIYSISFKAVIKTERTLYFTIPENGSLSYRGKTYTQPGKVDIIVFGSPCDTIEHLIINYAQKYEFDEGTIEVCDENPYYWHGKAITQSGSYIQRFKTVTGGDSIYHAKIILYPRPTDLHDTTYICSCQLPYWWRKTIQCKSAGTYSTILPTSHGCDTTAFLHLYVQDTPDTVILITNYCMEEGYTYKGQTYYTNQTFIEKHKTRFGCDSVTLLRFQLEENTYFFDSVLIKKGSTYDWKPTGKSLSLPGLYRETRRSMMGTCDTVYMLSLAVSISDTLRYCKGDVVYYNGKRVTTDKTFTKEYRSSGYLDSVVNTIYIFNDVKRTIADTVICKGQTIEWHYDPSDVSKVKEIDQTGTHVETLGPCNTSELRVKQVKQFETNMETIRSLDSCQMKPFIWDAPSGAHYEYWLKEEGKHSIMDTTRYQNGCGCDSLITTNTLICTRHYSNYDTYYLKQGGQITIGGQTYNTTGSYCQIIKNEHIDSIYYFRIEDYIQPEPTNYDTTVCWLDLPITFYGKVCKKPGVYTKIPIHYHLQPTLDSAYINLRLHVEQFQHIDTSYCASKGFLMPYSKITIHSEGLHYDTIPNGSGCDSVVEYKLTQWKNPRRVVTICALPENLPVYWKASDGHIDTIYQPGTYISTFPIAEASECDSIVELHLLPTKPYSFFDTIATCSNEPVMWHGQTLTQPGDYTARYTTSYCGIDSTYHLHLIVRDTIATFLQIPLYNNGKYIFNGHTLTLKDTSKISQVILKRAGTGCDSIVRVKIVFATPREINLTPCEGDKVVIKGTEITKDGDYAERWPKTGGGDSVVIYHVNFIHASRSDSSMMVYPGELPFLWKDRGITISDYGEYHDTVFHSTLTCPVMIWHLSVIRPNIPTIDTTIRLCSDELPYNHLRKKGLTTDTIRITRDTTVIDTLRNNHGFGLDTLYRFWHYHIIQYYSDTAFYQLCEGDSMKVGNTFYHKTGYYTQLLKNVSNQDSISRFTISVFPKYEMDIDLGVGCDSIRFEDQLFTYPGFDTAFTTTLTKKTIHGCDSIIRLHMTIHATQHKWLNVIYPQSEKFIYKGEAYSSDTSLILQSTSPATNCEIFEHLTVQFYDESSTKYNYYACNTDATIIIGSKTYRIPQSKKDTMINDTAFQENNTMNIQRIHLHIGKQFHLAKNPKLSDKNVCAGKQVTFHVAYSTSALPDFYDVHFMESDLEFLPADSTYTIHDDNASSVFPITMKLDNDDCIYPGKYTYTITFRSGACFSSVQTDTNTIWVYYPSDILYSKWEHFVALNTHSASTQCDWDLEPPFKWFINNREIASESDPNQLYFTSSLLKTNHQVTVWASRKGYNTPVPSYPITYVPQKAPLGSNGKPQIIVEPTSVAKRGMVQIQSSRQGNYILYNPTGNACQQGEIIQGNSTIQMPGAIGFYLLQIHLNDGSSSIERLIVY